MEVIVFSKVMRRFTFIAKVIGRRRGIRFALQYAFMSRLGVSRDITRGNIYLAIIQVRGNRCAIATVGRALRHSGLKLLRIKSGIGIRHSVIVGNHLSKRVMRKRISYATRYITIRSTRNDRICAFHRPFSGRVIRQKCFYMSGNSIAIGNMDLAIYHPAGSAFRIYVVPCACRRAGFRAFHPNSMIGLRFSVVNGCFDQVGTLLRR